AGVSATAGSDFTVTNGVLTFNNGVTSRTFLVPIVDDLANESDETIALQLGSPTGTSLGSPPTALLTIQDNDLPPVLSIRAAENAVIVSWPTQASNFELISAPVVGAA